MSKYRTNVQIEESVNQEQQTPRTRRYVHDMVLIGSSRRLQSLAASVVPRAGEAAAIDSAVIAYNAATHANTSLYSLDHRLMPHNNKTKDHQLNATAVRW